MASNDNLPPPSRDALEAGLWPRSLIPSCSERPCLRERLSNRRPSNGDDCAQRASTGGFGSSWSGFVRYLEDDERSVGRPRFAWHGVFEYEATVFTAVFFSLIAQDNLPSPLNLPS